MRNELEFDINDPFVEIQLKLNSHGIVSRSMKLAAIIDEPVYISVYITQGEKFYLHREKEATKKLNHGISGISSFQAFCRT